MMSDARILLGIDLGTSAVKAGLFTTTGELLGLGRCSFAVDFPFPGWAQVDTGTWWIAVCESIHSACREAGVDAKEVDAVGLSVLFPAVVPLNSNGTALHPAILYNDQRSISQIGRIEKVIPRDEYEARTGNTLMPGNCAITSMTWLRDERPDVFTQTRVIGFANTFLASQLTGVAAADPSMAALSGLADIHNPNQWDISLCERLGIAVGLLPVIVGPHEVLGEITTKAARETGLRRGVPVCCGCGDAAASAFGAGSFSSSDVLYVAGSTDCVTVPLDAPAPVGLWVNSAYVQRDKWLAIGTTLSSGASVDWFCREILGGEEDMARERLPMFASASVAGSRGILFLPYLQGERTPIWDPRARGTFFGLSISTARSDLARSVLEGTAFALRAVVESFEAICKTKIGEIRAVGGGTRNTLWNQIKSDVLGVSLSVLTFQETGVLGAALLAGIGCGVFSSASDAARLVRALDKGTQVEPTLSTRQLYDEAYYHFKDLYRRTRETAHFLADRQVDLKP